MKRMIFPFLIKVRPSLRDSAFSLRFPAENFRTAKFSAGKTLRKRRDGRKRDSEGENCDRRSACATRKRTVREPLFMPYPGMKPLFSPAVVKALLLPLHCICGLFCPYPRPPVLPALSLRKTATATGGVTQTFPDMEEHSGKKSGRRAIIWLYNNKVVFLQKIILWL